MNENVIKQIIAPACKASGLELELEARAGWLDFFGKEVVVARGEIKAANIPFFVAFPKSLPTNFKFQVSSFKSQIPS